MKNNRESFASDFINSFRDIETAPIDKFISVANKHIKFVFYSKQLADTLARPFRHLICDDNENPDFTIFIACGSEITSPPPFDIIFDTNISSTDNRNLYFNTEHLHFLYNTQTTITSLVNTNSKTAYYFIDSPENLPDYEKAAPFRMIFHWFGNLYGMSLIHGAVLSKNGNGWLVAGRGGAGKSTLTLLSFLEGTPILGDDYVLVDDTSLTAYSLYNSIKVNPDIISKYPFIDHYLANRTDKEYEKGYLFADEIPGNGMEKASELKGIIMITGERSKYPEFSKITGLKALSVIGSSSVFQMPGINRDFLKDIVKLVNKLDNYKFTLGGTIKENLMALNDFIDPEPLISIIMPVFNGSSHLEKSVGSVSSQTYGNYELIIVDDGSTDDTEKAVNSFADDRIKYIRQDNAGPAAARNNGLKIASGRYIAFIDHDDKWHPEKLEKQLAFIKHNNSPVIYCRHNLIFKGNPDDYPWIQRIDGEIRYAYEIPSSMFTDRHVFDQVGVFNPEYRTAEDSDLHLRIMDAGININVMDDILLDKHIHGENISKDIASNRKYLTRILSASIKRKMMLRNPRISVLIPAYNPDMHLVSCIKSILGQTLEPYEIIVADDGSKNDIKSLLSCFNDPRIKIHRQENKGISGARNFAVSKASGNILAFMDSDDLWTRDKLRLQMVRLISDSLVNAVFGNIRQFYSPEVDEEYRAKYYFEDKVTKGIIPGTMMISKEDFEAVGPFNENLRLGELFEWIHRFQKKGFQYAVLPDVLMYRRLHYNNNGILNKQDRVDFAKAFAQIIKDKKNERN